MRVSRLVRAYAVRFLTSDWLLRWSRRVAWAVGRRGRVVELYVCASDPHSYLALQAAQQLVLRYEVSVRVFVVPETSEAGLASYATSDETQFAWRIADARVLSNAYEDLLRGTAGFVAHPSKAAKDAGSRVLLSLVDAGSGGWNLKKGGKKKFDDAARAMELVLTDDVGGLAALEQSTAGLLAPGQASALLVANSERLRRRGHYLSGVFHYGFEWFWGVDRVHFLEDQLLSQGMARDDAEHGPLRRPLFDRTCALLFEDIASERVARPFMHAALDKDLDLPAVELFVSFRSPYSQIVLQPLVAMLDFYGLRLRLRPVLPMVMRGLKVPFAKKLYIVRDARREAKRLGWSGFGLLNDPLGKPVENAFAAFVEARKNGKEREYMLAWADHVYARGTDANTFKGMAAICRDAGFPLTPQVLQDESWREVAEENRVELVKRGLWGVPVISFQGTTAWGQDRLFLIEQAVLKALSNQGVE